MTNLSNSRLKYLNNNDVEKLYFADNDEDEDDFDFQYVPVNQFKNIIKNVKRQKLYDKEEQMWTSYLKEQENATANCKRTHNESNFPSTRTLAESIEEVDKELLRLQADTLPETNSQFESNIISNQDRNTLVDYHKEESTVARESCTCSANFLLTIPKEKKAYSINSSECHKQGRTFLKKSHSDCAFRKSKVRSKSYHSITNDLNYASSPDFSPDRLNNENDLISLRANPISVTKILNIQRKISTVLNSISYELDRIPLPDGENDLFRRQQRVAEFSTRLSRNYLYDLSRQISDIQRHIKVITSNDKLKLSKRGIMLHMQVVEQKLISAHQLLLAALNAYWKHIPSSVLKNHAGKLKEILTIVLQLKSICTEIKLIPDFYCSGDDHGAFFNEETENQCSIILSKFRLNSDNESQVPSHTTRSTTATPSREKHKKKRKMLANRLSMYAMDTRLGNSYYPKRSQNIHKFSKYKIHNGSKPTKIRIPVKEDDIKTIMETVATDVDVENSQMIKPNKKSIFYNKPHKITEINKYTKETEKLDQEHNKNTSNSSQEICSPSLLHVVTDLLLSVKNKQTDPKLLPTTSINAIYDFLQTCQPNINLSEPESDTKSKNEVSNKNMQLVCYTAEEDDENHRNDIDIKRQNDINLNNVSCQTNHLQSNEKINLLVSESAALCLLDYRKQYQHIQQSNPMYTSNTTNKPWDVIAWITDKLIDELIVQLANDFEMEEVIQKLFELEFEEF